jgi:hypothetical protein
MRQTYLDEFGLVHIVGHTSKRDAGLSPSLHFLGQRFHFFYSYLHFKKGGRRKWNVEQLGLFLSSA